MDKKAYNIHITAMTALFIMGNAILTPKISGPKNTFWALFISAVLTLLIITIVSKLLNFAFLPAKKHKVCFYAIALLVGFLAAFGAFDTIRSYIGFLTNIQLPQTSPILICVALVIPVSALVICSNSALYKFCLLSSVISVFAIALVFIGGIKSFDFTLFKSDAVKTLNLSNGILEFLRLFLPVICISAFMVLTKENACAKQITIGASLGFFATAICLLQLVLTLGTSANQEYPYFKAMGIISSGSLFTRLDGFGFWLFFVCALVKSTVCIKIVWLIIKLVIWQK